jgi:hypothetical protein
MEYGRNRQSLAVFVCKLLIPGSKPPSFGGFPLETGTEKRYYCGRAAQTIVVLWAVTVGAPAGPPRRGRRSVASFRGPESPE